MTVEIMNVGTELLLGEIVNTNAVYLQKFCKEFGFDVYYQSVVGDNPQRLKDCLQTAFSRGADCVITTGGLGPTQDDLTKEISAEFLGLPMVLNEKEAEVVAEKCRFLTGRDDIPQNNFKQAVFPENCVVLENPVGTACGCVMEKAGRMIVNLPGPPKEMTYVAENALRRYFKTKRKHALYSCDILTMGIGESAAAQLLEDLIAGQKEISVAPYASEETVRIRLACKAPGREEAFAVMDPLRKQIEAVLSPYIIREADLKEAFRRILPPYRLDYRCDFRFRDSFFPFPPSEQAELLLTVSLSSHSVGEILQIDCQTRKSSRSISIPLLKKAELSHSRLESRAAAGIYRFLKEENNCARV